MIKINSVWLIEEVEIPYGVVGGFYNLFLDLSNW